MPQDQDSQDRRHQEGAAQVGRGSRIAGRNKQEELTQRDTGRPAPRSQALGIQSHWPSIDTRRRDHKPDGTNRIGSEKSWELKGWCDSSPQDESTRRCLGTLAPRSRSFAGRSPIQPTLREHQTDGKALFVIKADRRQASQASRTISAAGAARHDERPAAIWA